MMRAGYLRLIGAGEPYRLLFPLGAVLGMIGVSLWPLFVYGHLTFYPGVVHARMMIQGFVFCFLAGFLGTALPHMLEVKGLSFGETMLLAVPVPLVAAAHLVGLPVVADSLFAGLLLTLLLLSLRRWPARRDLPPPGFVLAVLGLVSGAAGSVILACSAGGALSLPWVRFGSLLLYHGLVLLPVMGVAPYLLPRMFGLENRHMLAPASPTPSSAWKVRAAISLACGLIVLAGFCLEAAGATGPGLGLRAAGVWLGLLHALPLYRIRTLRGSIPWALLISIASVLAGLVIIAIQPRSMMTWQHLVFISGIGLLILNIAARVMLGHSGQVRAIYARSPASWWITGLVLIVTATRISADLLPRMRFSHYAYAAIAWVAVTVLWLFVYGRLLTRSAAEESG